MVWYSHLLNNFAQFVVIHTVKGFSILSETEVDVFRMSDLMEFTRTPVNRSQLDTKRHRAGWLPPTLLIRSPAFHGHLRLVLFQFQS